MPYIPRSPCNRFTSSRESSRSSPQQSRYKTDAREMFDRFHLVVCGK